ncbi:hypothetical protein KCP77_14675 [Salmonella enterica subsp. enterica]|nr:hypothetical protein KCP77_14675 [Salmonella enterica subsp. enterica]
MTSKERRCRRRAAASRGTLISTAGAHTEISNSGFIGKSASIFQPRALPPRRRRKRR